MLFFKFRQPEVINGALINGLEARVSVIEKKMQDIDARTSEEVDNALNERELDRFIMSGNMFYDDIIRHPYEMSSMSYLKLSE